MKLLIERFGFGVTSTLGRLSIDGVPQCFTIEDGRRRVKKPGETCIPVGTYAIKMRTEGALHAKYAQRFPAFHMGMLWLQDVPNFEYVYLHAGNTAKDSEGCPLLVTVPFVSSEGEFTGGQSATAYEAVYRKVWSKLAEGVTLTIREREVT